MIWDFAFDTFIDLIMEIGTDSLRIEMERTDQKWCYNNSPGNSPYGCQRENRKRNNVMRDTLHMFVDCL